MELIQGLIGAAITIISYTWWVVLLIFGYYIIQNNRKRSWVEKTEHVLLMIEVPRNNEKKELSAEQMFASLHGILRSRDELRREGMLQEHLSFEIVSASEHIRFFVYVPKHLRDFVEGQIYAQYPNVEIRLAEDYTADIDLDEVHFTGTELTLKKPEVFPIKTFQSFEVDPLAGITSVLSKLEGEGEQVWIQILARPVEDEWQQKGLSYVSTAKGGGPSGGLLGDIGGPFEILAPLFDFLIETIHRAYTPPEEDSKQKKADVKLTSSETTQLGAIEEKSAKLGYSVKIRLAYLAKTDELSRHRIQAVVGAFKQFNTTNLNGFSQKRLTESANFLQEYRARLFIDNGFILNIEELASLYHLPHVSVETPNIVWTTYRKSEPPANLPVSGSLPQDELAIFGKTNFRHRDHRFGIKTDDRRRHMYIIGKTGMGKSYMMEGMAIADIMMDRGVAFIDPHGDGIEHILQYIPDHRIKDVILIDPSDMERPLAFNPLEVNDPVFKGQIASGLVGVMKRIWADSWGPRLEYILRLTILALLDEPEATMLGITRMLTDKTYRKQVVKKVQDPVVKHFWVNEFSSYSEKFANEAVAPILNKVGQFLSTSTMRNIVGQPHSTFDLREAMDSGKILLFKLSTGLIGEDNAHLLGAMMVTKIQLAAMSRANVPEEERRDFYLYVDEFQNFATDSFAVILSEARKYRLNLIMANQYIAQMPDTVKNAIFGNVGTMITFRVGAGDAAAMQKEFEPAFEASDLINLPKWNIYLKLVIDGITSNPYSAQTLTLSTVTEGNQEAIRTFSREHYGRPRVEVEDRILKWSGMDQLEEKMEQQERNEEQAAQRRPRSNPLARVSQEREAAAQRPAPAPQRTPAPAPRPENRDNSMNRDSRDGGQADSRRKRGKRGGTRSGAGQAPRIEQPKQGAPKFFGPEKNVERVSEGPKTVQPGQTVSFDAAPSAQPVRREPQPAAQSGNIRSGEKIEL